MQRAASRTASRSAGENSNEAISSLEISAARSWISRGECTPCLAAFKFPGCEATRLCGFPRLFIANRVSDRDGKI